MSDERLHFDGGGCTPHGMAAAEHLARYALVAPFVRGKRVLDIACGEGYGSWFLKEWGAREVVGMDISADAIEKAKRYFGRESVTFLAGDACCAADQLEHRSFDLVVSFETIEHVDGPNMLLKGLQLLCAPGGAIFVSCPNDHAVLSSEARNPYHLRKYTFEEFRDVSESVLGPASQWLLGANVQGYALIPEGDPMISSEWSDWKDLIKSRPFAESYLLPSQMNLRPDRSNVLYYLGVWGIEEPAAAVAFSAQSFTAFIEPWRAIEWFKSQLSATSSIGQDVVAPMTDADRHGLFRQLTGDLAETRHRVLVLADIVKGVTAERDRLQSLVAQAQDLEVACTELEREAAAMRASSERVSSLEREVRRLESECKSYEAVIAGMRALSSRVPSLEVEVRTLTASVKATEAENVALRLLAGRLPALESELQARDEHLSRIFNSHSWRWTRIIRLGGRLRRGEFGALREAFRRFAGSRDKRD